ncbi:MAG: hypothetical protein PHU85_08070 [Phycisphaerae bacterium]|nr:hypothetical protein [Phycisphaerae bacterium]
MIRPFDSDRATRPPAAGSPPRPPAGQVHPGIAPPTPVRPPPPAFLARRRRGFSSILATYYVALFSGLAIAYAAMSGINSEATGNARKENLALSAAESGLSIVRYHLTQLHADGTATQAEIFASIGAMLQNAFNGTVNLGGRTVTADAGRVFLPAVQVDTALPGATFEAEIVPDGASYRCTVTGRYAGVTRSVRVTFEESLGQLENGIMNNGIVSRGSVNFNGSAVLKTNVAGGCGVMSLDPTAQIPVHFNGSAQLQGDIYMVKPGVNVDDVFNGSAAWGPPGGTSFPDTNADNHVFSGIDEPAWPEIDVAEFTSLINTLPKTTITSSTKLNGSVSMHNVYIAPNANPRFNGTATISGLVYIAYPNNVVFNGSTNITGAIICEPPPYEPSVTASPNCGMNFNGSITTSGVENLPDTAEYAGLRDKKGAFLIAKDYDVLFNGAMGIVNGTMYTSGLRLNGSTTGTIRGSILVDRQRILTKNGSVNVTFEVNADAQAPAGFRFTQSKRLVLRAGSYQEV